MTWPPLGLWYLGAQLEAQGHQTEFFDLSMDELPGDGEFDQLWLSATAPQMAEIRRIGKITEDWKWTRTVLGGASPWANPQSHKDIPYDLIVAGEADHPDTVREILSRAEAGLRDKIMFTQVQRKLDWVLPPIRRWSKRYKSHMPDRDGKMRRMTSLFTSRGCPMECAFCESGRHGVIWDRLTRYEPIETVEAQIQSAVHMGFDGLAYYDDVFILNRRRTMEMLELHKKYGVVFRCFLRSDILVKHGGRDYLKAMADAGLIEVFVGVESADNQIKENITKGTAIEQDTLVAQWCKELGVTCKMSFILGLPGETRESMEKTRRWILENRPERVQVDRLIPFPGTPLTDHPEKYDLNYENRPDEDWFFRGRLGAGTSFVSTSDLSVEEIDEFWADLERELQREGLTTFSESEKAEAASV
jgi:anaerobic magnesium-protoporphyrin IX monomethyl ester cyclase